MTRVSLLAQALCVVFVTSAVAQTSGGNSGEPDPHFLLGPLTTYGSEDAAIRACGQGQVVWAERYSGFYYLPREKQYGVARQGAFACMKEASDANYWGTDPIAGIRAHRGKSFKWYEPDA
jgi:hypothetical protein